jgi:hypothetical protein
MWRHLVTNVSEENAVSIFSLKEVYWTRVFIAFRCSGRNFVSMNRVRQKEANTPKSGSSFCRTLYIVLCVLYAYIHLILNFINLPDYTRAQVHSQQSDWTTEKSEFDCRRWQNDFSFRYRVQTGFRASCSLYLLGPGSLSPGLMRLRSEADHSRTYSLSLSLSRCSHSDHRASVKRFVSLQFLSPKTVGRTSWTGYQPIARTT